MPGDREEEARWGGPETTRHRSLRPIVQPDGVASPVEMVMIYNTAIVMIMSVTEN